MANSDYLIAGNDEHGLEPMPTVGKRTPYISQVGRSFYENEFNKEAKRYFLEACARQGFRTLDVKPGNQDLSLTARAQIVNASRATLLVTFAYNAAARDDIFTSANGVETFYSPLNYYSANSKNLATKIQNRLVEGVKQSNRGVNSANFYMLRAVNCPSVLVEAGFMTNLREAKLMMDPDFQRQVGEEACRGVCDYLGVSYKQAPGLTYPLLKRGSRGDKVKYLQYKLLSKFYNPGEIDGIFGSRVDSAVRQFQKDNNLVVDGIIGKNTWNKLKILGGGRN
jgi:hypothetical protein